MGRKPKTSAGSATGSKSHTLTIREKPGRSHDEIEAEMAVAGLAPNAMTTVQFLNPMYGELGLTECLTALQETVAAVHGGDLRDAEALLTAQAVALNAIFTQLAQRAARNLGEYLDAADRYMRLALKAQSQCRTTLETLAAIKNPPTVFARQANIAHGPQQVNNTMSWMPPSRDARAGNPDSGQIELLEAHGERLDLGAAGTAGAGDQALATVGTRNRPANG